jgi:Putative homoserine kinase type II (protein kinase fold)
MNSNFSFPVLEHPAPTCDSKNALDLAKEWMQLDQNSVATPLVSERDRNFLISAKQEKAILKISNHKEERGVLEFQTEALLHLQKTTSLNLPRAKKNIDGEYLVTKNVGGEDCFVRMVTYLEGIPLDDIRAVIIDPKMLHLSMGNFLANAG